LQFLDIVVRWPGQEHDSRIFANSRLKLRLDTGQLDGRLVGDSGYPSLRYLLTPFLNPATPAEERYNRCQILTLNPVERTFGVWKRRFPCLTKRRPNELTTTVMIIIACAVLHNIAVLQEDQLPDDDEEEADADLQALHVPVDPVQAVPGEGLAVRNALVNQLFT